MSLVRHVRRHRFSGFRFAGMLGAVLLTAAAGFGAPERAVTTASATTASLPAALAAEDPLLPAPPQTGPAFSVRFSYSADGAELAEVLKAFAVAQGMSAVISPALAGKVTGQFDDVDPERFLQTMASTYGVTWYRENSILYFYASNEMRSQFLALELLEPAQALAMIRELGFLDPRFPIRSLESPPMLHVTGPPRYIENVQAVVQTADRRLRQRLVRREEVRVFKLRHAWADDTRFALRDREQVIPGVATTLRRLMTRNQQGGGRQEPVVVGSARGSGILTAPRVVREVPAGEPVPAGPDLALPLAVDALPPPLDVELTPAEIQAQLDPNIIPSIEADPRQNAVIVRDSAERMPLYEEMIRQLDVPTQLVEIHACIVDINEEVAFEAGLRAIVEYSRDGKGALIGLDTLPSGRGSLDGLTLGDLGNLDSVRLNEEIGSLLASGVVLNDHWRFLGLIKALEDQGQARIYSRPSLVTFANMEAELRDDQTYNVRVAGERDAELFSVTAGVQLRVTPYVISDTTDRAGRPRIRMTVHIEDGSFDDARVDGLPLVRTSALNTQAVINLDQSLLVGGYLRSIESERARAVPGLSRLPAVGALFRGRRSENRVMQRMFILTPRLINLDYACPPEQAVTTPRTHSQPSQPKQTKSTKGSRKSR